MALTSPTPPHDTTIPLGDERSAFLSGPPRSGQLSPFAQKLAAQCFVWLASLVVFGSSADFATSDGQTCTALCKAGISIGVISFVMLTLLLLGHYLIWSDRLEKSSWLSSTAETKYMIVLCIWWVVGVSCLSAVEEDAPLGHTTGLAQIFGWLAFFGALYGAYKAYHSQMEEMKSLRYAQILSMQATEEEEYANFS